MIPATYGPMSPTPFATYDPASSSWRTSQGTFETVSASSSPTLPPWGSMRNGVLYARPTPEPPTVGRGSGSLLATPHANASTGPGAQGRDGGLNLQSQVSLLPTPRSRDHKGAGSRPNGHAGDPLPDVVALLPTPAARDHKGASLPTRRGGADLVQAATGADFGPYTAAVQRWEQLTCVPAPPPTIDVNGSPRLNPAFVEWMQGLSPGWVTEVEGVSRSAALKMLGNGVVPQQALLALDLIDIAAVNEACGQPVDNLWTTCGQPSGCQPEPYDNTLSNRVAEVSHAYDNMHDLTPETGQETTKISPETARKPHQNEPPDRGAR